MLALALVVSAEPSSKLPPETAREMSEAVIAVNKALGLESWPARGVKPCLDRGGEGSLAKTISPADTRRCAEPALATGFPQLGKTYVLAVLMAEVGPATVIAVGKDSAAGWGAYSCDPGRACKPAKITAANKWGKRLAERQQKACAADATVWLPAEGRVCPPAAAPAPAP